MSPGKFVLQPSTAPQAIQMLSKTCEAVNRVLIRLSRCLASLSTQTAEPFRLGFCQIFLQTRKARLVVLNRFVYFILTGLANGLLENKGAREHAKEGGKRIQGLYHVQLEVFCGALGPYYETDEV